MFCLDFFDAVGNGSYFDWSELLFISPMFSVVGQLTWKS